MNRKASEERKTKETDIKLSLDIDGSGETSISSGIPFFDHMLTGFARHGFFDLIFRAEGDLSTDPHHLIEDSGIVLGQAIKKCVGDRTNVNRFGAALIPMDDALAQVALDLSGRAYLAYEVKGLSFSHIGNLNIHLFREFYQALVNSAGINLHISLLAGDEPHHAMEAIFKAFGRALDNAVRREERNQNVPSTKGILE